MTDPYTLKHVILNSRALLRRKITPALRARLEARLPELEALASELDVDVSGWRAYPGADGSLGELDIRGDVQHGHGYVVERLPRGKRRKAAASGHRRPADAMGALEARLVASMRGADPPAAPDGDLEQLLAASLRAVRARS